MFTVTPENLGSARAESFLASILETDLTQIDSQQPYLELDFYALTDYTRTLYVPCPDIAQFQKYLFGGS